MIETELVETNPVIKPGPNALVMVTLAGSEIVSVALWPAQTDAGAIEAVIPAAGEGFTNNVVLAVVVAPVPLSVKRPVIVKVTGALTTGSGKLLISNGEATTTGLGVTIMPPVEVTVYVSDDPVVGTPLKMALNVAVDPPQPADPEAGTAFTPFNVACACAIPYPPSISSNHTDNLAKYNREDIKDN